MEGAFDFLFGFGGDADGKEVHLADIGQRVVKQQREFRSVEGQGVVCIDDGGRSVETVVFTEQSRGDVDADDFGGR